MENPDEHQRKSYRYQVWRGSKSKCWCTQWMVQQMRRKWHNINWNHHVKINHCQNVYFSFAENTHDGTVLVVCETARLNNLSLNNLSLNSKKMQFKSTDCKCFGHRLTFDGIKVDPKKTQAIVQMDPPQNVASLQSFNGIANYLKTFSPVSSKLSEPLRRLCKSSGHGNRNNRMHLKQLKEASWCSKS